VRRASRTQSRSKPICGGATVVASAPKSAIRRPDPVGADRPNSRSIESNGIDIRFVTTGLEDRFER
jgi:hypothetical protein